MKTKYVIYLVFASLAAVSFGCSLGLPNINRLDTGATQTFALDEPHPGSDAIQDIRLSIMGGKINISGGSGSMLDGQVRSNVVDWKPKVVSNENSLMVSQGVWNETALDLPVGQIVNDWDVRLGNFPMNLTLEAGVYDGTLNLSGLPVHRLQIDERGGNSEIDFNSLNPAVMDSFTYHAGLSDIALHGLANANFTQMTFEGRAGDQKFDFSGDLQRDASVTIDVGLSDVEILVPKGTSARVEVEGGLSQVYTEGSWTQEGSQYANLGNGPQLNISVKISAGSLHLVNE